MVREQTPTMIGKYIKETGKIITNVGKVSKHGLTRTNMKAIG